MNIRPKTVRRLAILFVLFLAIAGVIFVGYVLSQRRLTARIEQERVAAMTAYKDGDYNAALPHFNFYLTKARLTEKRSDEVSDDAAEALFAYGESRRKVEMPNRRHLIEAKDAFQIYRKLRPDDMRAKHALLQLYPPIRYDAEAITLADEVLAKNPSDTVALWAKVYGLLHQQNKEQALAVTQRINEIAPHDLNAQQLTQDLIFEKTRRPDDVIALAQKQVDQNPNDAYFEVMLAYAYKRADQRDEATKWFKAAAEHAPPDLEFIRQLTGALDRLGMTAEATQLVERSVAQSKDDPSFLLALVQRKYESGEYEDVADRLAQLDPKSSKADTQLLGIRAVALYALRRNADAAPIVDELASRRNDLAANAWANALQAGYGQPPLEPREMVKRYQDALGHDPSNAIIRFMLAQAYARLGESEPAIEAWQRASELAPNWAAPHAMMARIFVQTGRYKQAREQAQIAYKINSNVSGVVQDYLVSYYNSLDENAKPEEMAQLLKDVEKVQAQQPFEPQTLPIQVALLARSGRRLDAQARIETALRANPPLPAESLLRLADVSNQEKLGAEQPIMALVAKTYGSRPGISLQQALLLADAGKTQEGLESLQKAQAQASADPLRWRIAVAEYRDRTGDASAMKEWVELGDQNPKDLEVQRAVLQSPARYSDRDFWKRSIDRVKELTGDEGVLWRIERARWLLSGDAGSKESAEAVNILTSITQSSPTLPEPHRLLASALEQIGKDKPENEGSDFQKRAAEELKRAAELAPDDAATVLELTRLLANTGRREESAKYLDRLIQSRSLTPAARAQTARTLAARGYWNEAIAALLPAPQSPTRDALLAALYNHTGKTQEAADSYMKVLAAQTADPVSLADAADFFARLGQPEQAEKFVQRLSDPSVPAGVREILLGHYDENHTSNDAAAKHFQAAADADPNDLRAKRELAGFLIRQGQYEQATATADSGLKIAADDEQLKSLKVTAEAMKAYGKDQDMVALARVLSADPRNAGAAEMFKVMAEAKKSNEEISRTVAKLDALAQKYPALPELQAKLIQGYLELKKYSKAESIALHGAQTWPNDPRFARLLVAVYHAQGPDAISRAMDAAKQWRARSAESPLEPDLAIADMLLQTGRPGDAAKTLEPYVASAAKPEGNAAVVGLYAQALIESSRASEAAALLKPLAQSSEQWRLLWLGLAGRSFRDGDAAANWIEQVKPMLSPDSTREQQALADAWFAVGQQCQYRKALENARELLKGLVTRPDANADTWLVYAATAESLDDITEAERGYREVLKHQPETPAVCNNLAYVLLSRGTPQDVNEALTLSDKAVAAAPENATFYDTRARIYAKQGKREAAIVDFQTALKLDRGSLEAMIGLADMLSQSGQADAAKALLREIAKRVEVSPPLPPALRKQLESVQSVLNKQPLESGRAD